MGGIRWKARETEVVEYMHRVGHSNEEIAEEINMKLHGGEAVRSAKSIAKKVNQIRGNVYSNRSEITVIFEIDGKRTGSMTTTKTPSEVAAFLLS